MNKKNELTNEDRIYLEERYMYDEEFDDDEMIDSLCESITIDMNEYFALSDTLQSNYDVVDAIIQYAPNDQFNNNVKKLLLNDNFIKVLKESSKLRGDFEQLRIDDMLYVLNNGKVVDLSEKTNPEVENLYNERMEIKKIYNERMNS